MADPNTSSVIKVIGNNAFGTEDVFEKELNEGPDACMTSLLQNWDGILAAGILEAIQWGFDFFFLVNGFLGYFLMQIPFIGLVPLWFYNVVVSKVIPDWSRGWAHGAQADIRMARNNSRCASNIYASFDDSLKPDYTFAGDTEFYLNSIGAAQLFYISFLDLREGMGFLYTIWPLGPIVELVYQGASLFTIIATLMLQADISKLAKSPVAPAAK